MADGRRTWGAKILVAAALSLLLSFGMCGAALLNPAKTESARGYLFVAGIACLGLVAVLVIVGMIVLIVESQRNSE
ncbi:hypothetical protein SAMN05421819_4012 [Bryocella elongata]|uniref:Uncharacterized protein n=1 Tax=Bryocella elongata TaxID=863522 RepID=A0A1H6BWW5_9BACT|nr:hypothetical protein [Bryocella elongata]SEG65132.1 hypothetical protein SAMN05421819_4012 [Bryocella elongata]